MKTLYLDGQQSLRVLRDGPTLRVRAPASADRLFPLRRLCRVVVSGPVEWSTDALLACAEARVPVSFLTRDGDVRARVLGTMDQNPLLDLNETLEAFLDLPDGLELYRNWVANRTQNERLRLVRQAQRGLWPTKPAVLSRLLFERARLHARAKDLRRLNRQIHGLLATQLHQLFTKVSLKPDTLFLALAGVQPVRDFVTILGWTLENDKLRFVKRQQRLARRRGQAVADLSWAVVVQFYEEFSPDVDERFRTLLRHFHRYMLETIHREGF